MGNGTFHDTDAVRYNDDVNHGAVDHKANVDNDTVRSHNDDSDNGASDSDTMATESQAEQPRPQSHNDIATECSHGNGTNYDDICHSTALGVAHPESFFIGTPRPNHVSSALPTSHSDNANTSDSHHGSTTIQVQQPPMST